MAYSAERFNENAAGMTGFGHLAVYDGSGRDAAAASADNPDEGGDLLATIRTPGFFPISENGIVTAVADAVRIASRRAKAEGTGIAQTYTLKEGAGLPIILRGNDAVELNLLYEDISTSGSPPVTTRQLRLRNAGWRHT